MDFFTSAKTRIGKWAEFSGGAMSLFPTQEHKRRTAEAIASLNAAYPNPSYAKVTAGFSILTNPVKPTGREINAPQTPKLHPSDEPTTKKLNMA